MLEGSIEEALGILCPRDSHLYMWCAVGPGVLYAPIHTVSTFNCEIRTLWQRMIVAVMRVSLVDRDPRDRLARRHGGE